MGSADFSSRVNIAVYHLGSTAVFSLCAMELRRKFAFIAYFSLLLYGHHLFVLRTLICLIVTLMHFKILYCTSELLINFLCNENTANFGNVSSLAERPILFRSHIKLVCDYAPPPKKNIHIFPLTFRHRASCILGQAFHYSPENVFIYLINKYISLSDICLTVHH